MNTFADMPRDAAGSARLARAGYALGFGLSGLFDGILLHQVLQWHHLLSALQQGPLGDLRVQILADGLFHVIMYAIAALGLWWLLASRATLGGAGARRRLLSAFWIGFGLWHVADAVFSHWLVGLHRIRMDSAYPLAWDLAWLAAFGIVPLLAGFRLRRPPARPGGGASGVAALLVATTLAAGAASLFPLRSPPAGMVTLVLRPGAHSSELLAGLEGIDARIVWSDRSGSVWVLRTDHADSMLRLYRHGAMYVGGTAMAAGCLAWIERPRMP